MNNSTIALMGLMGVAAHYYTNFIDTLLEDSSGNFHTLIGTIMHEKDSVAGCCYIFTDGSGTGKTSIMNILRKVFETDASVIFVDDIDPNLLQVDPAKTYFIATNLSPDRIKLKNACVLQMSGRKFPLRVYKTYMHDFEQFTDAYKLVCDSECRIWNATKEIYE